MMVYDQEVEQRVREGMLLTILNDQIWATFEGFEESSSNTYIETEKLAPQIAVLTKLITFA